MKKLELKPKKDFQPILSVDKLRELMGLVQWEFEQANRKLRELQTAKNEREAKTDVILWAKRPDLLTNEKVKAHYIKCLQDEKFKLTVDLAKHFIYLENQDIMEEYEFYEKIASQAEKEYKMLTTQMMWYLSENKVKVSELFNKL